MECCKTVCVPFSVTSVSFVFVFFNDVVSEVMIYICLFVCSSGDTEWGCGEWKPTTTGKEAQWSLGGSKHACFQGFVM